MKIEKVQSFNITSIRSSSVLLYIDYIFLCNKRSDVFFIIDINPKRIEIKSKKHSYNWG
jgi:hypothetical protein